MNLFYYKNFFFYFILFIILIYIFLFTGLNGDDFWAINELRQHDFQYYLDPDPETKKQMFFALTSWYLYWWAYFLLEDNFLIIYDLIKIIIHLLMIYLTFSFMSKYFSKEKALLGSLTFIFFPTHDSTVFWLMVVIHVLGPCSLLFFFYLIEKYKKYFLSFLLLPVCFISYANPPFMAALSLIFILKRKYKEFFIFSIPCFIYIITYFGFSFLTDGIERRVDKNLSIFYIIKNFILQILSLIDSFIGPSFFLKIYYSYREISIPYLIFIFIAIIIIILIYKIPSQDKNTKTKNFKEIFLIAFFSVFFSICMFSLTGLYNHSPFGLNNRTTVYFSFFASIILISTFNIKFIRFFFIFVVLIPLFGLSNHWKNNNKEQNAIIKNISNNKFLQSLDKENTLIIVKGYNFSILGKFSNIEVFSMPWNTSAIFEMKSGQKNVIALTDEITANKNLILNNKHKIVYDLNKYNIYLYDLSVNKIDKIDNNYLLNQISNKKKEIRHWVQLEGVPSFIKNGIIFFSPRLNYLFI
jgi:hypothetical protein